MDSLSGAPALPALDNTMGVWLLGTCFGALYVLLLVHALVFMTIHLHHGSLQGVQYNQTVRYFRLYPHDPRWLKFWVSPFQVPGSVCDS